MKLLFYLLCCCVCGLFSIDPCMGQNFQNINSMKGSAKIRDSAVKVVSSVEIIAIDTSIRAIETITKEESISDKELNKKKQLTDEFVADVNRVSASISSKDSQFKKVLNESIESSEGLKRLYDSLKTEEGNAERMKLKDQIQQYIKRLEDTRNKLKNYQTKNKGLSAEIQKLRVSMGQMEQQADAAQKALENEMSKKLLAKDSAYFQLNWKFFQLQYEEMKRNLENTGTVLEEIRKDSARWEKLSDIGLNQEEGKSVRNLRDEFRDRSKDVVAAHTKAVDLLKKNTLIHDSIKIFSGILTMGPGINSRYHDTTLVPLMKRFELSRNQVVEAANELKKEIDQYAAKSKYAVDKTAPILEKYETMTANEKDFMGYGGFKKILQEDGAFVPDIAVFGKKSFGTNGVGGYGQMRLFTGLNTENANFNSALNYFVPEASSYGFALDLGLGFRINDPEMIKKEAKTKTDLAFNTSFFFLGKSLRRNQTDTLPIRSTALQWKAGMEFIFFKNFFSLRTNMNGVFAGTKNEEIKERFMLQDESVYWFSDIALTALLDLNEAKVNPWKLRIEIGAIPTTASMKRFIATTDKVIPQIKAELVKNF